MILGIEKEWSIFLVAILTGNQVYLVYAALCVFRRIIGHNLFWISVEDVVFWISTSIYLYICIFQTCNGSIRWYFVLGVLIGGVLTHFAMLKIQKSIDKTFKRD